MNTLHILLLLAQASKACQEAHNILVDLRLPKIAAPLHQAAEAIALTVGLVVKAEAEKRRAELAEVVP